MSRLQVTRKVRRCNRTSKKATANLSVSVFWGNTAQKSVQSRPGCDRIKLYSCNFMHILRQWRALIERRRGCTTTTDMSTEDRWELIEQYFLGNEEYVRQVLKIEL